MTVPIQLARATGADVSYYVKIDGVREPFVDSKRPDMVVGREHPVEADSIANWRMDAASFATEPDVSGNSHDASAAPNYVTSDSGKFSTARNFRYDGTANYRRLYVADHANLRPTAFTWAQWMYVGENHSSYWLTTHFAGKWSTDSASPTAYYSYAFGASQSSSSYYYPTMVLYLDNAGSKVSWSPFAFSGTTLYSQRLTTVGWNHVAWMYDGAGVACLYVNGVLVATRTHATLTDIYYGDTAHNSLQFSSTSDSWPWAIDDTALYSTVKSAEWVRSIYYSGIQCLIPPEQELSLGLDLKTMRVDASNMAFCFKDVRDPNDASATRRSYLGKLLSPARDGSSDVDRAILCRLNSDDEVLAANASTIYVQYNAHFNASGRAYLGAETFTYTGLGTPDQVGFTGTPTIGSFTGVTKGVYPALLADGETRGHAYPYPLENDDLAGDTRAAMVVTSEPFSMIGREIGLWASVREPATGLWSAGTLVWAGQIADDVEYDPETNQWTIAAESITRLFDRPIARSLPKFTCELINLNGDYGRTFTITEFVPTNLVDFSVTYDAGPPETWTVPADGVDMVAAYAQITVPVGYYSVADLANEIVEQINTAANWTDKDGTHLVARYNVGLAQGEDGMFVLNVSAVAPWIKEGTSWKISLGEPISAAGGGDRPCHALQALGFPGLGMAEIEFLEIVSGYQYQGSWQAERKPYYAYHPTHPSYNGRVMRINQRDKEFPFTDQGDWGTALAWIKATPEQPYGEEREESVYIEAYDTITDNGTWFELALDTPQWLATQEHALNLVHGSGGFVGSQDMWADIEVSNVYVPSNIPVISPPRGPLESLLYPLLSSGTATYNDTTYDQCPWQLAVDFPGDLIDTASVRAIDRRILSEWQDLAIRPYYVIDESTSWSDLWQREAQLFGAFLAWDPYSGTYKARCILSPDFHLATVTISQSVRAGWTSAPKVSLSARRITNQWKVEADNDLVKGKARYKGEFNLPESYYGIGQTIHGVTIKHPGLRPLGSDNGALLTARLTELFCARNLVFRNLHQFVTAPLAPKMRNLVGIGDVVYYTSTRGHPDPTGSGLMTVTTLPAIVVNTAWSPARDMGSADLLIFASEYVPAPWGVAAMVDISAANGGWDSANCRLTLEALRYGETGDPDDGAAFEDGDFVLVIESDSITPTGAGFDVYGPFEVDGDYETDGAQVLTLVAGSAMAGWDATKEHAVICAHYDSCTADQQARNLYQCSRSDHTLSGTDNPDRWG